MASALALEQSPNRRIPDRYDVTFRIIGGFPNREDDLTRNTSSSVT